MGFGLPKLFRRSKAKTASAPAAGILSPSAAGNKNTLGGFGSPSNVVGKSGKRLSKRQLRKRAKKDRAAFPVASSPGNGAPGMQAGEGGTALDLDKENKARAPQSGEWFCCHSESVN